MPSSKRNNWDEVMEAVNKTDNYHGPKTLSDVILDPPENI